MERYRQRVEDVDRAIILRMAEGGEPLRAIRLGKPDFAIPKRVNMAGVDSSLASLDQFDDVVAITTADFHSISRNRDNFSSRTDLLALNPRLVVRPIKNKVKIVTTRADISRELSKVMREVEYSLAFRYGGDHVVMMDGPLFGRDKEMVSALLASGIVFVCIVKNPISRMLVTWYPDIFRAKGFDNPAMDAVAINEILPPGSRTPFVFAQMNARPIPWGSKLFTYYKPMIEGAPVLRIDIPTDLAHLSGQLVEAVHCACSLGSDPSNLTAAPITHAEYVARAIMPNPYDVAERMRATLAPDALLTRMQGSFNSRRFGETYEAS
jgi:hypothetical protein